MRAAAIGLEAVNLGSLGEIAFDLDPPVSRNELVRLRRCSTLGRRQRRQPGVFLARRAFRQCQLRIGTGEEGKRDRLGRRPQQGPVGGRDRQPQAMAGQKSVAEVVELDGDAVALAGLQRLRLAMPVAMREIERPIADTGRGAARRHVAEPHANERQRPVDCELERRLRRAQELEALGQRLGIEDERVAVILALIGRHVAVAAIGTPDPRCDAGGLLGADGEGRRLARLRRQPARGQVIDARPDRRRRPDPLGRPMAGALGVALARRHAVLHPGPQHRLGGDAGVAALQPLVPPAQRVLQEPHRHDVRGIGIAVRPGTDQPPARHLEAGHQPRDGIGVAILPAADGVDWALDGAEILRH